MKNVTKHVLLPSLVPLIIICLYFTPKHLFGCATRGYLALGVALVALLLAFVAVVQAISAKRRGTIEQSHWWLLTAVILITPTLLLLGPLG